MALLYLKGTLKLEMKLTFHKKVSKVLLDCWKMSLPYLKGTLKLEMKLTFLKKVSKVVHFTGFFSLCMQRVQPF